MTEILLDSNIHKTVYRWQGSERKWTYWCK